MSRYLRFILVLFMAGVWCLFRRWLRPRLIFQVYGNTRQRRVYFPQWAHRLLPTVFPIGFIWSELGWGFQAGTKIPAEDLDQDPSLVQQILDGNRKVFPLATAVALAGRLPGFARRAGITLEAPFLTGLRGTTYAVVTALEQACFTHRLHPKETVVAIIGGAGHVGTYLTQHMGQFDDFVVVDIGTVKLDGVPQHAMASHAAWTQTVHREVVRQFGEEIRHANIVVNLSRQGDDMMAYVPYLSPSTVVLDDTHPPMHADVRRAVRSSGANLHKVVMQAAGLRMWPRLPDFSPTWVPGCMLEALVVLSAGRESVDGTYEEFARAAATAGVVTEIAEHLDEAF